LNEGLDKTLDRNRDLLEVLSSLYLSGEVNKTTKNSVNVPGVPTEIEPVFNAECDISYLTDKNVNSELYFSIKTGDIYIVYLKNLKNERILIVLFVFM